MQKGWLGMTKRGTQELQSEPLPLYRPPRGETSSSFPLWSTPILKSEVAALSITAPPLESLYLSLCTNRSSGSARAHSHEHAQVNNSENTRLQRSTADERDPWSQFMEWQACSGTRPVMCAVIKHDASESQQAAARDATCRHQVFVDIPSLHVIYCITPTEIQILFPHALNFIRHTLPPAEFSACQTACQASQHTNVGNVLQ